MFSKKSHADVKKSTQKFLDSKKDTATRLKHLRIVIDHVEGEEALSFFETHSTLIYYLLCDIIAASETNSKQRDLTFHLVHKAHREELDSALLIFEQLLLHLPDLLGRGWQQHALLRTMCKLLYPGNSLKLRKDAIRYFIIWYQALGENAPEEVDAVFATLVPGFLPPKPGLGLPSSPLPTTKGSPTSTIFHDTIPGPLADLQPVLPPQSGEKPLEDPMRYFLDVFLDALVSQVNRIEWKEKLCRSHKSFSFLLERFKRFYLPQIFPSWNAQTNLYPPSLDLPQLRKQSGSAADYDSRDPLLSCRVAIIKWIASFTHITKKEISNFPHSNSMTPDTEHSSGVGGDFRRVSVNQIPPYPCTNTDHSTPLPSLSDIIGENETGAIVREVLYSSRENVCFVLEVYRQAFLLPFSHAHAIRRAISVYKDWIQMNVPELPPFILEPIENSEINESESRIRLRNDSYLGAVNKDYFLIRAGLQNTLQLFITHAANVFLLQIKNSNLLEEQVDTCKRVLNIYRYMVMQCVMELKTWEQLLSVLLHITGLVLTRTPPKRKEETLGGKLAQAIFQTLIVTWIKANLNVVISTTLWDEFLSLLASLTQWEELIKEWAKTLETLTRVLARHVYSLDLTDLPLDRLSEQQAKKRRGLKGSQVDGPKTFMGRKGSTKLLKSQQSSLPETSTTPDVSGSFQFCSIRKRIDSSGDYSSQATTIIKSSSEGNLSNIVRKRLKRQNHSTNKNNVVIPVLPVSVETEVNKLLRGYSFPAPSVKQPWLKKWRSADSLRHEDSPTITRSPSPAPSSGIETSSIKDSPMPLDFVTTDSSSLESSNNGGRSIMAGGSITGWLPDVAVVLWRRMLGALGDVNRLPDPALHAQVFDHLIDLWDTLAKIQANQGVPEEGVTPPPPVLTPPLTLFAPWCFKALHLPDSYQRGKLSAYRLLCRMTLGIGSWALSHSFLVHLYRSLHSGLCGSHPLIVWTVLKSLGPRFLSRQLPGYSLLLLDLISASNAILESSDLQVAPRIEAASLLGSVLSLPYMVSQAPSLDPRSPSLSMLKCTGAKDHVLTSLLRCAKREPTGIARCTALSALAVFAYTELSGPSPHPAVEYAFDVILLALKFKQKSVCFVACDLLFALSDHMKSLLEKFPHLPPKVLKFLSHTLGALGANAGSLGPVLALTLGEWTMRFPTSLLLSEKVPEPLLLTVFTVLSELANGANVVDVASVEFSKELLSEWENSIKVDDLRTQRKTNSSGSDKSVLSLACRAILMHLVTHLGHFPMGLGAARLSALVQEHDDIPSLGSELSTKLFYAPNVQFMMVRHSLMSMIEVEYLPAPGGGFTAGLVTAPSQARVLLRDLANKASWDASALYCSPHDLPSSRKTPKNYFKSIRNKTDDPPASLMTPSVPPRGTLRHRPSHILPTYQNAAPDMDNLHDLLRYIGHFSPECLENPDQDLSEPSSAPSSFHKNIEAEVISTILAQRTLEIDYKQYSDPMKPCMPAINSSKNSPSPFQHCRQLFSQLGLAGWERRAQIQLLARSERLLRELRNLDTQRGRETHKIAVIYVAAGQEDKVSILSNKGGSQAYEQFVAGLAWEVELASHTGFNGGLNSGCGETAPYYASAFVEALFHVATRMPSDSEEALLQKMRHLGNDEVHIVWSEHIRDYRRSSIPTEFCDVLIVVYPLPDGLYRVTIDTKTDMPVFGPLWNESIVEGRSLAGLIRAAALSASRAKRRTLSHYQSFYEERFRSLSGVISNHKEPHSFEEFIAAVYAPGQPPPPPRSVQFPSSKSLDHNKGLENRTAEKVSPHGPKKLGLRSDSESPVISKIK